MSGHDFSSALGPGSYVTVSPDWLSNVWDIFPVPKPSEKVVWIPNTAQSTVRWNECRLSRGWVVRHDSGGVTLEGELYSRDPSAFPRRGDQLPVDGPCMVGTDFANYRVAEVEIEPLTSAGPYLCRLSSTPSTLDLENSGSLTRERTASFSVQRLSVDSDNVSGAGWYGRKSVPCQCCQCTWYHGSSSRIPPKHGIVTDLPSWTGAGQGRWALHEARAELRRDNDGARMVRQVNATFYRPCHGVWKSNAWGEVSFHSL